jgi:hypothetical protein
MTHLNLVRISGADWAFGEFSVPMSEFYGRSANDDGSYVMSFIMDGFLYVHDGVVPMVDYMFPSFGRFAMVRLTQDTIVSKTKVKQD